MFWLASLTVADEFSLRPTFALHAGEQWHRRRGEGGEADPDPAHLRWCDPARSRIADLDEFVASAALEAGEVDELLRACDGGVSLERTGDGDAAPARELEEAPSAQSF